MASSSRWHAELSMLGAVLSVAAGCVAEAPQVASCLLGTTKCGGECVTLAFTADHCGACGSACPPGESCLDGACLCAGSVCDGACVDTTAHPRHCGACDEACPPGASCTDGTCQLTCAPGLASCDERCLDTSTDRDHCGACEQACAPGANCVDSTCQCRDGLERCGEACVDPLTDARHCDGCDQACAAGELCTAGSCAAACGSRPCASSEVAWARRLGNVEIASAGQVRVNDLAYAGGGDLVVVGHFGPAGTQLDLGDGVTATAAGQDLFVARFDPAGRPAWVQRFGSAGANQEGNGVDVVGDFIAVAGTLRGTDIAFGNTMLTSTNADALVLVLDGNGTVQLAEAFGGNGPQLAHDVAIRPGGGVALTGRFRTELAGAGLSITSDDVTTWDAFLVAADITGTPEWYEVLRDPGLDTAQLPQAVTADDTRVAWAVRMGSNADTEWTNLAGVTAVPHGGGGSDAAVAVYDDLGNRQMLTRLGGSGGEDLADLQLRDNDLAVVADITNGATWFSDAIAPCPTTVPAGDGRDGVIATLTFAGGCPSWQQVVGGLGNQTLEALVAEGSSLWLAGSFTQELADGLGMPATTTLTSEGFVLRVEPNQGTAWRRLFGGPTCEENRCNLAVSPLVPWLGLAGTFAGTVYFRGVPIANAGTEDGYLAQIAR